MNERMHVGRSFLRVHAADRRIGLGVARGSSARAWMLAACAGLAVACGPAGVGGIAAARAQDAAAAEGAVGGEAKATQQPAADTENVGIVEGVQGTVEHRVDLKNPKGWVLTKVGDRLAMGAEIRTGPRAAVKVRVGEDGGQVLTLDRNTRAKLSEMVRGGGTDTTRVDLPYGRAQFEVKSTAFQNRVEIRAPDATLAVKGTIGAMEVTAGQATRAFGGELNTGTFDVTYETGVTARVERDAATDADAPQPAQVERREVMIDPGPQPVRDTDEVQAVERGPAGGGLQQQATGQQQLPATDNEGASGENNDVLLPQQVADNSYLFIDEVSGDLFIEDPVGSRGTLYRGVFPTFDDADIPGTGIALTRSPLDGTPTLLRLDNARVFGLPLDVIGARPNLITSFNPDSDPAFPVLSGLAALGGGVYTTVGTGGGGGGNGRVLARLGLGDGTISMVGALGAPIEPGIGGSNERGSLFLAASDIPLGGGAGGFDDFVLEFDPRNRYLVNAIPTEDFTNADGAVFVPPEIGPVFENDFEVTRVVGIAFQNGNLIFSLRGTLAGGGGEVQGFLVTVDPVSGLILRGELVDPRRVGDLASEELNVGARQSFALSPPSGPIDPKIDPLLSSLAYSPAAVASGYVEAVTRSAIINTADSPQQCFANFDAQLLAAGIVAHVNEESGVGQASADFRAGVPFGHPCGSTAAAGFFDTTIGALFFDVGRNEVNRRPHSGGGSELIRSNALPTASLDDIDGLATRRKPGAGQNGSELIGIVNRFDTGLGANLPTLFALDLEDPTSQFSFVTNFPPGQGQDILLFGLGAIGDRVFATGFDTASGVEGIVEPFVSQGGALVPRMAFPDDVFSFPGIEGSNSRGSVFLLAEQAQDPGFTTTSVTLLELDPRANYIRTVRREVSGDFTPLTGTVLSPPSIRFDDLAEFGAMDLNNGVFTIEATDSAGAAFAVVYDPGASNTPGDPRLVSITQLGTGSQFGLDSASEVTTAAPPGPPNLAPPSGPIDTLTLNALMAATAYSAQASSSGFVADSIAFHVLTTARSPANCLQSGALANLQGLVDQFVDQQAGYGQALAAFRQGLPANHPCQPVP